MNECIDCLEDAQVFSTFGFNSGYWQIELAKADEKNENSIQTTKFIGSHMLFSV